MTVKKQKISKCILWLLFICAVAELIWKIPYGWGAYDEPYYAAIPYRIVLGDSLITDEWNVSQLSSFLLIPIVWAYHAVVGSMDGIVIALREFYVFGQIVWSLIMIYVSRKFGAAGQAAVLIYLLFVPLNIMSYSYDSMGLAFMMMIGVIQAASESISKKKIFLCGFLFACAVLCNIFLIFLFAVYGVACVVNNLMHKENNIFSIRNFCIALSGTLLPAILFFVLLLSRSSVSDVIGAVPCILNDPTHAGRSAADIVLSLIKNLDDFYSPWIYIWLVDIAAALIDRRRYEHGKFYFLIMVLSTIACLAEFTLKVVTNCFMLPFAFLGAITYILSRKKQKRVFCFMWVWGIVYALVLHIASDQNVYVISMALSISDAASVILCINYLNEINKKRGLMELTCLLLISSQLMTESVSLARNSYWESVKTEQLNTFINAGPLKGIRTTSDKVAIYNEMLDDISEYRGGNDGRVAFMTLNTWEYLYAGRKYGTFSPWLGYINDYTINKFLLYCKMHPDKIPNHIYFSKLEKNRFSDEQIKKVADSLGGYTITESDVSVKLEKK